MQTLTENSGRRNLFLHWTKLGSSGKLPFGWNMNDNVCKRIEREYFWPSMEVVYGNWPALSPSDCLQRAIEVLKVAPETSSTRYVQSPSCCSHLFITFTSCPQNVALSWSGNAKKVNFYHFWEISERKICILWKQPKVHVLCLKYFKPDLTSPKSSEL